MDPPTGEECDPIRDEKRASSKRPAAAAADIVRGQIQSYREEPGVAPDSKWRHLPP